MGDEGACERTVEQYSAMELLHLAKTLTDDPDPGKDRLALPAMQRDGVWRPRQVLDLWRSLLAGLPIGLFYVERFRSKRIVMVPDQRDGADEISWSAKELGSGLSLIDGQQRLRALCLGLGPANPFHEQRRIWVRLVGDSYELLMTSRTQPFGYNKDGGKLRIEDRRAARRKIEPDDRTLSFVDAKPGDDGRPVYDSDLYLRQVRLEGGDTLPCPPLPHGWLPGEEPVPLDEIVKVFRSKDETECDAKTREVVEKLSRGLDNLRRKSAVLMYVELPEANSSTLDFFRRIGAGGTPLSQADQVYAALKIELPQVREVVEAIRNNTSMLLTPAHVTDALFRMANSLKSKPRPEYWLPGLDLSIRAIQNEEGEREKSLNEEVKRLVCTGTAPRQRLVSCFKATKELLGGGEGAYALSDIVLASLPSELWQVIAFWCMKQDFESPADRNEAVRLAMFWKFGVKNQERAAQAAFRIVANWDPKTAPVSPGKVIYQALCDEGWACPLHHPDDLKAVFDRQGSRVDPPPTWLTHKGRFGDEKGPFETAARWWYASHMLVWLQRDYLAKAFPGFLPLSEHEDDLPYDRDHICPREHWRHGSREVALEGGRHREIEAARDHLGDSIGNFRLVEASQNRSQGDAEIKAKLPELFGNPPDPKLGTLADFCMDDLEGKQDWTAADGGRRTWPTSRFQAFEHAVCGRTGVLYKRFFVGLGFDCWFKSGESAGLA